MTQPEIDIVIVEDDPNDAELLMRLFRKHNLGNRIIVLKDGAEALDFFFARGDYAQREVDGDPKIVLLDLKLPKINGIEVLHRIKSDERTKGVPVVVLTSSREPRDVSDAYRLGVNSYVTKPIKFDEFAKTVAEMGMYWLVVDKLPNR